VSFATEDTEDDVFNDGILFRLSNSNLH